MTSLTLAEICKLKCDLQQFQTWTGKVRSLYVIQILDYNQCVNLSRNVTAMQWHEMYRLEELVFRRKSLRRTGHTGRRGKEKAKRP